VFGLRPRILHILSARTGILAIGPAGGQDTGGTGRRPLMAAAVKL